MKNKFSVYSIEGDELDFPESEGETSFEEDVAPVEESVEEIGGLECQRCHY
jgi:hypothetical protein